MRELSLHILDVLQNAVEAGATQVELSIVEDLEADRLTIVVQDNGPGMDAETARRAIDPFFTTRTTRHVGLGLPLFAAAAGRCDGGLELESVPGRGTTVTASFRHSHLDRAPLGCMTDTLLAFLLARNGEMQLRYRHRVDGCGPPGRGGSLARPPGQARTAPTQSRSFELDTAAMQAELGEIPLSHPRVREWLRDYVAEGEAELRKGGNHAQD